MSNVTVLLGAEDVASAGRRMRDAAHTMQQAAATIDNAVQRLIEAVSQITYRNEEMVRQLLEARK